MKKPKITKIEVSIEQPQVTQITAKSHPGIWNMLLAPEDRTSAGGKS
jgi:hypothetical protein